MTSGNGTPSELSTSEARYIASVLLSGNLKLRNGKLLTRSMVTAVQPLSIDGVEICTDMLLAEFVEYQTSARLVRETDTLTLKKTAFSAFEATMTPIPKYCFNDISARKTVLVHSVSRFTLEDILREVEKVYKLPLAFTVSGFIADWAKLIKSRVTSCTKAGRLRSLRMVVAVPSQIFPLPKRIPMRERKTFASGIFATVLEHHKSAIYHDSISPRTIFYPTSQKPQLLSNYSGVPSPMLADYIPMELMSDDATIAYGPDCRDAYCCALIGYRILTGEALDGRAFSLGAPRPLRMVLRDVAKEAGLTFTIRNVGAAKQMVVSLVTIAKEMVLLLPRLLSRRSFATWQKINCVTGGFWRRLPLVGPLCNIFAPAKVAKVLRVILDKPWFLQSIARSDTVAGHERNTALHAMYRTFALDRTQEYPGFVAVLDGLNSETVQKRNAFGSVMGSVHSRKKIRSVIIARNLLIIALVAGVVVASLLLLPFVNNGAASLKQGAAPQPVAQEVASEPASEVPLPVVADSSGVTFSYLQDTAVQAVVETTSDTTIPPPVKKRTAVKKRLRKISRASSEIAAVNKGSIIKLADTLAGNDSAHIKTPDTVPAIPVIPKGLLSPVTGKKEVLVVSAVPDSCNPGKLFYSPDGKESGILFCQLPKVARRLYLARKGEKGFGSIEIIRLCQSGGCDRTMFYEPVGVEGIGKPVFVRSGDVISSSRLKLWQYVQGR